MSDDLQLGEIGQIARTVDDIKAAEDWYGRVLGLKHLYTYGTLAFFDLGGTRLMLSENRDDPAQASLIYLKVDDIHKAHDQLSQRGAEFVQVPHMIHKHEDGTEEWMAFFNDNQGRPIGLMSAVKDQP